MTMPVGVSFANVPKLLVAYFTGQPGVAGAGIKLPNSAPMPFVLIEPVPAGKDDRVTAKPLIDISFFHNDMGAAIEFARVGHDAMLRLRGQIVNGVPVDDVETDQSPGFLTYENPLLFRFLGSYFVASSFTAESL